MKKRVVLVGARPSPLSKAQVAEVLEELQRYHPHVAFETTYAWSYGDKDRKTSLRSLDKTNFFTKEIDDLVLKGECHIGIHSAKDLPEPLTRGLSMVALTKGVDSSDSLVMGAGESLETLRTGAIVATSSERREMAVRQLRSDLTFCDLRGTILERLEKLETGEADAVVIAEAALIRLNLTHLNRVPLPGDTIPFQGQLAVIARSEDREMAELFRCMDSRS